MVVDSISRKRWIVVYLARTFICVHQILHSLIPLNMTIVSNDPVNWPIISYFREWSYFDVASFIVVLYDWGAYYAY
jgi:hypothetical protein